ncbi:zinc finger protein 92 homolog [Lynx pardinus]|uniref:Zinc finger protein 92 homolog n=1 Tax=Lynx pardinus TaxID=191816 RepID=A0A485N8C7_LYNPA|nr:zinc finger protein 92 homolog [Lynx pardinus]
MAAILLKAGPKVPVSFEDVPVYFIKTGWKLLDLSQRILYKRVSLENYRHFVSLGQGITPLSGWPHSPPTWGSPCPPGPHASKVHASRVHGGAHAAAQPRGPAGGGGRGAGGQPRGAGGLVRPEDPAACPATLVVVAGYPAWRWSDLAGAWRMNFRKVWEMHLANCHYQGVNF